MPPGAPRNRGSASICRSARWSQALRVMQADVEQRAAASGRARSSMLAPEQLQPPPAITHGAHTTNVERGEQRWARGARMRAPEWPRTRPRRMEHRRAAQVAMPPSIRSLTASAPLLRHDVQFVSTFIAQRVELLRSRFELGTGPDLVRAEFASASRAADGRRHENGKSAATDAPERGTRELQ